MAPWNLQRVYLSEAAAFRHGERLTEGVFPDVSLWLCQHDPTTRSQGVVNLGEESSGIVNFMHNGEYQCEVNLILKVRNAEGVPPAQPSLNPVQHVRTACPTQQRVQHLLLEVYTNHSTTWADESRQG